MSFKYFSGIAAIAGALVSMLVAIGIAVGKHRGLPESTQQYFMLYGLLALSATFAVARGTYFVREYIQQNGWMKALHGLEKLFESGAFWSLTMLFILGVLRLILGKSSATIIADLALVALTAMGICVIAVLALWRVRIARKRSGAA